MPRKSYFKEWRKHRGLTLEAAAQSAEMTAGNLSAIECGAQGYTQTALEALAAAYDTEPASLLSVDPTLNGSREIPLAGAKSQRRRTFIKEWREHRGLTQEQLANQVGWSVSNVPNLNADCRVTVRKA